MSEGAVYRCPRCSSKIRIDFDSDTGRWNVWCRDECLSGPLSSNASFDSALIATRYGGDPALDSDTEMEVVSPTLQHSIEAAVEQFILEGEGKQ